MRLFEAIIDANHRALNGDPKAGFHLADYAGELPVVAMTCIDPRLTRLFPGVMGLPPENFIWLRNAGNIITGPLSSMMRSISLACAVKGGREIALIGHTDCAVCRTSIADLTEKFRAIGVPRNNLPQNLVEYFGVFSSERDNVIQATNIIRHSPLISPSVPVQGLMVDVATGKLEWVINGYDEVERLGSSTSVNMPELGSPLGNIGEPIGGSVVDIQFPTGQIGETSADAKGIAQSAQPLSSPPPVPAAPPPVPPPIPQGRKTPPIPPPINLHPGIRIKRG